MSRKIFVSLLFILSITLGSFSVVQATFKDDAQISSEAKKAVNYMKDHRIMVGYNDLFSPQNVITRGEVAKILTVALGIVGPDEVLSNDVTTNFSDMKNHWANPYVQKLIAYNPSIINGYPDGTFQPNKPLRKDELVKLLVVAFDLKADAMPVYLKDHNNWAKDEIETVAKLGIEIGTNLYFQPASNVNRESVALMVYRVLVPSERISIGKNSAINKDVTTGGSTGGNTGSTYPDGWVPPVLNHTWSPDPLVNDLALQQQLGFNKYMGYDISQQPDVIRVLHQNGMGGQEVQIWFKAWNPSNSSEGYRVKIIAKEVFKLYFGSDYQRVYNYFEKAKVPETFTANGRTINCEMDKTGALVMEIGYKK